MNKIMVFARESEFLKAMELLDGLKCDYDIVAPTEHYQNVAVPAILFSQATYAALMAHFNNEFVFSGVVDDYLEEENGCIEDECPLDDAFGRAVIMYASPCFANEKKIRIIAHISKEIDGLMPYLNTYLKSGFYNSENQTITFMEKHRMVSLYKNKVAIAKADDIKDVWRLLNKIRNIVNTVNSEKHNITPSWAMKKKPAVFEVYNYLPKINCGECEQKTCMAFAAALQNGSAKPVSCTPIFKGDFKHLQEKYFELCNTLGLDVFS